MTNLIGGAIKKTVEKLSGNKYNVLYVFLGALIILLIKTYLVKLTYNKIMPKIMKDDNIYNLTYTDSLFLVILISSLI